MAKGLAKGEWALALGQDRVGLRMKDIWLRGKTGGLGAIQVV